MNAQSLMAIMKLRDICQSDLARMIGVSRQAVSLWFKAPDGIELNVRTPHLRKLASALQINAEDLLQPLPLLDDAEVTRRYETTFLWDRLYSSLADFTIALVRSESAALARLVQVFGIYKASKIAGPKIWNQFPKYKQQIRPIRREQVERIWKLHENLKSS
jgi:transcriptional regulator with XRE-family HTH domain